MKPGRALLATAVCLLGLGAAVVIGAGPAYSAASFVELGSPNISASGGATPSTVSRNWSGYAVTAPKRQKFNYVHTTFVQPALACAGNKNAFVTVWTGLDGLTNGTVEQEGTEAHCAGSGFVAPVYVAWYEMFPGRAVTVFAVHAGDVIDATTAYTGGQFSLTVTDLTTNKTFTHTAACTGCARKSAEWVVARPARCSDAACSSANLTKLADFGTVTLSADKASVDGGSVKSASQFSNVRMSIVANARGGGFVDLDGTGSLATDTFTVTWQRFGTLYPITLAL